MKRLWAPWRMTWITASKAPIAGCVFCSARDGQDDRASLLLQRSEHAFLILNSFPYAPGHLMAVIKRHTGALVEAGVAELSDAMQLVQRAVTALTRPATLVARLTVQRLAELTTVEGAAA